MTKSDEHSGRAFQDKHAPFNQSKRWMKLSLSNVCSKSEGKDSLREMQSNPPPPPAPPPPPPASQDLQVPMVSSIVLQLKQS